MAIRSTAHTQTTAVCSALYYGASRYTHIHTDNLISPQVVAKKLQYMIKMKKKQEAFEKCWAHSPLRAISRPFTSGTVARRLRIDVHDNDNDNA